MSWLWMFIWDLLESGEDEGVSLAVWQSAALELALPTELVPKGFSGSPVGVFGPHSIIEGNGELSRRAFGGDAGAAPIGGGDEFGRDALEEGIGNRKGGFRLSDTV